MSKYRARILKKADKYYQELSGDFSHDINHFLRVDRLAHRIGIDEGADLEILEAAALLFDIARGLEDRREVIDHAQAGSDIARQILTDIGFPNTKIEPVCHAILVHRKSQNRTPQTLEAKILQDADYLDSMGAMVVARVIGSSFQSEKYRRPIYLDIPSEKVTDPNITAIHYLQHLVTHPKFQPQNLHTKLGRQIASSRFAFMKTYTERFISEWEGLD
jgi:uncharacterized protein